MLSFLLWFLFFFPLVDSKEEASGPETELSRRLFTDTLDAAWINLVSLVGVHFLRLTERKKA